MIIFNILGAGIFAGAVLIVTLFAALLGKSHGLSDGQVAFPVATGSLMVLLDLWYRMKVGEGSLLHPRRGGHVCFIPVWVIGGVWVLAKLCAALGGNLDAPSHQSSPNPQTSASQLSSFPGALPANELPSSRSLKLGMISGVGAHRIATINGEPFAEGESHTLAINSTKLVVQCTEIREQSVVVQMSGDSNPHELKIGEPLVINRR
jgi:hypothetical protein